jgi:hypothetical protein
VFNRTGIRAELFGLHRFSFNRTDPKLHQIPRH